MQNPGNRGMNGIHDMGGMHGFGDVDIEDDAAFHADWERVVYAMDRVLRSQGFASVDEKRHAIERMAPADYLTATYFERWIAALETLATEKNVVTDEELDAAIQEVLDSGDEAVPTREDSDIAARAREAFEADAAYDREPQPPRFESGDDIRVRNMHPSGHTRCPRYARRARGTIDRIHGTYVFPDANAHGEEEAEPLYSVAFTAEELWGSDRESDDIVYIDLWESYLEAI